MTAPGEELDEQRAAEQGEVHVQLDQAVPWKVDLIEGLQVVVEALERCGAEAGSWPGEVDGGSFAVGSDTKALDGKICLGIWDEKGRQGRTVPPEIAALADKRSQPLYDRRQRGRFCSEHVDVVQDSKSQRDALGPAQPRFAPAAIRLTGGSVKIDGER